MGLDRLPEILGLLVLGLIIFGPKRMIELGGQVGRALRELQTALKEMNWNLTGEDSASNSSQSTLGKLSQIAQDISSARAGDAAPAEKPRVVEAAAPQPANDPPAE
jgi:sec-independent protein translocase protein TatA